MVEEGSDSVSGQMWCGEGLLKGGAGGTVLVQVKKCTDCIIVCVYMYVNVRMDRQVSILTDRKVDSKVSRQQERGGQEEEGKKVKKTDQSSSEGRKAYRRG